MTSCQARTQQQPVPAAAAPLAAGRVPAAAVAAVRQERPAIAACVALPASQVAAAAAHVAGEEPVTEQQVQLGPAPPSLQQRQPQHQACLTRPPNAVRPQARPSIPADVSCGVVSAAAVALSPPDRSPPLSQQQQAVAHDTHTTKDVLPVIFQAGATAAGVLKTASIRDVLRKAAVRALVLRVVLAQRLED